MKNHLISMFMDNELDLDQKVEWVEAVSSDSDFKKETIDLLKQEKLLRSDPVDFVPPAVIEERHRWKAPFFRAIGFFSAGLAAVFIAFWGGLYFESKAPGQPSDTRVPYRFVVYQPEIARAEITGSFTQWQTIPMIRSGDYWEVTLDLPHGEHRFSYIFDGHRKVADPTVAGREKDDFGGENSILEVKQAS